MRMLTVSKNEAGQRLDKLLAKYLNLAGKASFIKDAEKEYYPERKKCDGSEHRAEGDEDQAVSGRGDDREVFGSEDSEGSKEKLDISSTRTNIFY